MKYRLLPAILAIILLCGCFAPQSPPAELTDDGFTTDIATDALNYTTYVDKELGLVMNLLATHLGGSRTALDATELTDAEQLNIEESLGLLTTALDSVDTLRPPEGYDELRLSALRRLESAEEAVVTYQTALELRDADMLERAITLMENAYVALTGAFTVMPE